MFLQKLIVLAALAATVIGIVLFVRDQLTKPGEFTSVQVFDIDLSRTIDGVTVNITRVSYHAKFQVEVESPGPSRQAGIIERSETVYVEGRIVNNSGSPIRMWFADSPEPNHPGPLVLHLEDGKQSAVDLNHGFGTCLTGTTNALEITLQGGSADFSGRFTDRGSSPADWVLESVRGGTLPSITSPPFTSGRCDDPVAAPITSVDFAPTDLPEPTIHDYYPFGPARCEFEDISPHNRPYWSPPFERPRQLVCP